MTTKTENLNKHPLEGMYVHTRDADGKIKYQGRIKSVFPNGSSGDLALVLLFSWLTGYPTSMQLMRVSSLIGSGATLYSDEEAWRDAGDANQKRLAEISD